MKQVGEGKERENLVMEAVVWSIESHSPRQQCRPDVSMVLGTGHSYWHGLCGSMALGHQPDLRLCPRLQPSAQPSVVSAVTDINTDLVVGRPQTQTWPLVTVQAWISPWTRVTRRPFTSAWGTLFLYPSGIVLRIARS